MKTSGSGGTACHASGRLISIRRDVVSGDRALCDEWKPAGIPLWCGDTQRVVEANYSPTLFDTVANISRDSLGSSTDRANTSAPTISAIVEMAFRRRTAGEAPGTRPDSILIKGFRPLAKAERIEGGCRAASDASVENAHPRSRCSKCDSER